MAKIKIKDVESNNDSNSEAINNAEEMSAVVNVASNNKKHSDSTYNVGGYTFYTKESAKEAKNELNAIKYLSAKTDGKDIKQVYLLYNNILDKELFKTQVGLNYLKDLQQHLYLSQDIPNDRIRPIPINTQVQEALDDRKEGRKYKNLIDKLEKENKKNKSRFITSLIINLVLIIVVGVMYMIAMSSENPTIIDYEIKLQDKYATWQEQLLQQEESLRAREKQLQQQLQK